MKRPFGPRLPKADPELVAQLRFRIFEQTKILADYAAMVRLLATTKPMLPELGASLRYSADEAFKIGVISKQERDAALRAVAGVVK